MSVSPTLRLWQLSDLLRSHRDGSGLTIEQAAERLREFSPRWSRSKLQRIEARVYAPQPAEIAHFAAVYALPAPDVEALTQMAREARLKGWWQSSGLPKGVHLLAGLEQAATNVRQFELALVPGLLQTSDYARALVSAVDMATPIEVAEEFVAARMIRQQIIKRDKPVQYHAVLSEAVLRCAVGGSRVMRGQLEHLVDLTSQPHITLQILPFDRGGHPGLEGPFSLLTLPELGSDVGYAEGQMGAVYLESQDQVRSCTMRFGAVSVTALTAVESLSWIEDLLSDYR